MTLTYSYLGGASWVNFSFQFWVMTMLPAPEGSSSFLSIKNRLPSGLTSYQASPPEASETTKRPRKREMWRFKDWSAGFQLQSDSHHSVAAPVEKAAGRPSPTPVLYRRLLKRGTCRADPENAAHRFRIVSLSSDEKASHCPSGEMVAARSMYGVGPSRRTVRLPFASTVQISPLAVAMSVSPFCDHPPRCKCWSLSASISSALISVFFKRTCRVRLAVFTA